MNHKYRREYDKQLIGRNLRRCRETKNLSVEAVREYLCLGSQQAIYKWEEGKCFPQTDTLLALMELYEMQFEDLIFEGVKEYRLPYTLDSDTAFVMITREEKNCFVSFLLIDLQSKNQVKRRREYNSFAQQKQESAQLDE